MGRLILLAITFLMLSALPVLSAFTEGKADPIDHEYNCSDQKVFIMVQILN